MLPPLVSVLIPCFNSERWIRHALESAVGQDYSRTEVIVVDDGSTDRTLEIAKEFESRSVRVITQPNAGAPAARNTALAQAQGQYIQWLDADDLLARNKVSVQMRISERLADDLVLISSPFATFYHRKERAKLYNSRLYKDLTPSDYFYIKFSHDTFFQPAAWLASRRLTDLAGPWWELRSPDDDGEYYCRVVAASRGIYFTPESIIYWRIGNLGSLSWGWKASPAGLEALFQSTVRCIEHYRKLEDTENSRLACLNFLQHRLVYFFPDSINSLNKMYAIAEQLGGTLTDPLLPWKYQFVKTAFGWSAAKKCMYVIRGFRSSMERDLDQLIFKSKRKQLPK